MPGADKGRRAFERFYILCRESFAVAADGHESGTLLAGVHSKILRVLESVYRRRLHP